MCIRDRLKNYTAKSSDFIFSNSFCFCCNKAKPKVKTPTLPINIRIIMRNFPRLDKSPVIPVLNPTVPRAEATSNNILSKEKLSLYESKKENKKIKLVYNIKVEVAM
eukprot:TRINITY_DN12888_c0_g1_i1.p1 TRINITY_DN12888_c0_g1~~TRINITY_DN12888_c0_g1_i1.p1  ORF type:complete len:107 (-),score=4.13 TRINITY_DN12888_c0_g1_i1:4-324(-)